MYKGDPAGDIDRNSLTMWRWKCFLILGDVLKLIYNPEAGGLDFDGLDVLLGEKTRQMQLMEKASKPKARDYATPIFSPVSKEAFKFMARITHLAMPPKKVSGNVFSVANNATNVSSLFEQLGYILWCGHAGDYFEPVRDFLSQSKQTKKMVIEPCAVTN
jgi:hypothetical protein